MSSVEFHSSCALLVFGYCLVLFTCTSIVQNYILIHVCVFWIIAIRVKSAAIFQITSTTSESFVDWNGHK